MLESEGACDAHLRQVWQGAKLASGSRWHVACGATLVTNINSTITNCAVHKLTGDMRKRWNGKSEQFEEL